MCLLQNEEQVEDMTSTNQVLSGIKECAKDAEEESKTAFFSRDGIAVSNGIQVFTVAYILSLYSRVMCTQLAEPIGHSTPQKQQSLSNGILRLQHVVLRLHMHALEITYCHNPGGDEVELSIAHSLPSEDAHLFIQVCKYTLSPLGLVCDPMDVEAL